MSSVNHKFSKAHKAERESEIVGVLDKLERASDVVNVSQQTKKLLRTQRQRERERYEKGVETFKERGELETLFLFILFYFL